ncbi:MAG: sigma-70 family RNA polymerase sigma factor [Flavobacteriaceae bacterium]|nr:sigma-70 family RNA polymerase sigma factor [Deltaproteobacteria bacterium]MBT6954324.1 sigma-70 family RNA polymerase sigma factor [Flavobacteriaceae bacterium]
MTEKIKLNEPQSSDLQEGSVQELSQWVEEHGDLLYRFARGRVNSHELAEDLVQITFTSALKDWDRFRRESSPKTWLVSILRHKIIDHYRRKKTDSLEDFLDGGESVTQSAIDSEEMVQDKESIRLNPEEILEHEELRQTLRECLDGLPDRLRQIFVMRDIENESTELICEKLEISVSNFSVMMYRARFQLRNCFLKNGFPSLFNNK